MLRSPRFGQFSLKGGFQDGLAIPLVVGISELLCRYRFLVECVNARIKSGEKFSDFRQRYSVVRKVEVGDRCGRSNLPLMLFSCFQDGLAIPLELGLCFVEFVNAYVKFGKELFDLGNNTVLFEEWRQRDYKGFELVPRYRVKGCSHTSCSSS